MIRNIYLLVLSIIWLSMITGCSQNDYSDLEAFIHSSGEGLQGKIDPLPEVRDSQNLKYAND